MAKKRAASRKSKAETAKERDIREIRDHEDMILRTAMEMYDSGERVSITNVYHRIKGKLGLPGHYDFDLGEAIREILKREGWIPEGRAF